MNSFRNSRKTWLAALAIAMGSFLLGFAFWHFHDTDPMWAITSFVLVYDPDMRSTWSQGMARLVHTLLGSVIALGAIYLFGLHKWLLPLSLSLAAVMCGLFLQFRGSWRVVLVTVTLIIGSTLLQPTAGWEIATMRALEVSAGSLLAIALSALMARIGGRALEPENDNV